MVPKVISKSVPIHTDRLPEYGIGFYEAGLEHPEVARFMTWYQLERGDAPVPDAVRVAMNDKVAAIRQAQRPGTVNDTIPAAQILALVLAVANMWSQPGESLHALVPKTKRRKVISDAAARLVRP